jgi:uncharacterized protein (TIGR04255 family)
MKRPHFRKPPIMEQAISLVFERLVDFDNVDFGLFWSVIRDKFPEAETTVRVAHPVEYFEERANPVGLTLSAPSLLARSLFRNPKTGELLQIQDDFFGFSWVKPAADSDYPRFDATSARFWEFYQVFQSYLSNRYGICPTLRQCELINVNIVPVAAFGTDYGDMARAFKVDPFDWQVTGLVAETYIRNRQHAIVDDEGTPVGRLHSVITPVIDQNGEKHFQFQLLARSAPIIQVTDEARLFFNRAHEMINGAFVSSVTPLMLEYWEQYDGD